jgi:hypothetical protein
MRQNRAPRRDPGVCSNLDITTKADVSLRIMVLQLVRGLTGKPGKIGFSSSGGQISRWR